MAGAGIGSTGSPGSGQLVVTVRETGSSAVLTLVGELDHDTADTLRDRFDQCLDALETPHLVLDCAGLEFCDSTGLNVLLSARLKAEPRGGAVHLAAMKPAVARVFQVTGADAVFRVHPTVDDALGSVPSS